MPFGPACTSAQLCNCLVEGAFFNAGQRFQLFHHRLRGETKESVSIHTLLPLVTSLSQLINHFAPHLVGSDAIHFLAAVELAHAKQWTAIREDPAIADFELKVTQPGRLLHRRKCA